MSAISSFTPIQATPKRLGRMLPDRRAWTLISVRKFLGIEVFVQCNAVCKTWNGQIVSSLKNKQLQHQYSQAFFRLICIDFFNRMPTDPEVQNLAMESMEQVRATAPRTATFQQLIAMKGDLRYFDSTSLFHAEIKYQNGELIMRFMRFKQLVACLTDVVNLLGRDEFIAFMQDLSLKRKEDRLETINDVFKKWNLSFATESPEKESPEKAISLIPGLSGFVPVKTSESCCIIL